LYQDNELFGQRSSTSSDDAIRPPKEHTKKEKIDLKCLLPTTKFGTQKTQSHNNCHGEKMIILQKQHEQKAATMPEM
jgi:hypothetical protein